MATVFQRSVASFSRPGCPDTKQKWFRSALMSKEIDVAVAGWPRNSPDLNPIQHQSDVLDKKVQSMEERCHKLTSRCKIPQHWYSGFYLSRCLDGSGLLLQQKFVKADQCILPHKSWKCIKGFTLWFRMNKYVPPAAHHRLVLFYSLNACTHTEVKPENHTESRHSSLVDGSRGLP